MISSLKCFFGNHMLDTNGCKCVKCSFEEHQRMEKDCRCERCESTLEHLWERKYKERTLSTEEGVCSACYGNGGYHEHGYSVDICPSCDGTGYESSYKIETTSYDICKCCGERKNESVSVGWHSEIKNPYPYTLRL